MGEWRGLQEKEGSDFYSFSWLSKCIFEKRQMDLYVILKNNLIMGIFIKIPTKNHKKVKLEFIFLRMTPIFVLTRISWIPELKCFKKTNHQYGPSKKCKILFLNVV